MCSRSTLSQSFQNLGRCHGRLDPFVDGMGDGACGQQWGGHAMAHAGSAVAGIPGAGFHGIRVDRPEIQDRRFLVLEHIGVELDTR